VAAGPGNGNGIRLGQGVAARRGKTFGLHGRILGVAAAVPSMRPVGSAGRRGCATRPAYGTERRDLHRGQQNGTVRCCQPVVVGTERGGQRERCQS
jgi:hypothetical protein